MEVLTHVQRFSTCQLLMAVLTETLVYLPNDLSNGVGIRSVPNLTDMSCLLCTYRVVQRV